MIEPPPHESGSSVSRWRVGNIKILGGLVEQLVFVDCASRIETEEVWAVDTHVDWVTLDAFHHHFGNTDTLAYSGNRPGGSFQSRS